MSRTMEVKNNGDIIACCQFPGARHVFVRLFYVVLEVIICSQHKVGIKQVKVLHIKGTC